jgi:predicted branched-subunit amino acid permease
MTQIDADTVRPPERSHDLEDVLAGVRAMAPMLLAYAPFGLLVGAAVAGSQSPTVAWLSTWTIYGGAAHLAVLEMLQHDAGVVGAALVGLLINARLVAYAVSLAPHWRATSPWSRVAAAAMLTDATWALARTRVTDSGEARRRFYFGAAVTLWFGWPVLVTLGVLTGGWTREVPAATLLPSLTLGTLVVPQLRTRPGLAAGTAAAVTALATASLDGGAALALSAAVGTTAAALAHRSAS